MTRLAIFDLDGTLTDTNAVDGECYLEAASAAAALRLPFVGVGRGARADRLRAAGALAVLGDFADLAETMEAIASAEPPRP
ncbi:MAG TPA: hypothetical protein VGM86_08775 [Thermoanaerobaculia bacterium]|jgi:phosphoglycolate phosphatase-like HAD superfamily hydrolase